jgi:hypothetical protein
MTVVGHLSGLDQLCHVLATSKKTDKIASESPWGYLNSVQPREKCVSLGADAFGASQDHALQLLAA